MGLNAPPLPTPGKIWGWCIDHNHLWVVQQIPNALTLVRVFAPLTFYLSYHSFTYYGDTVSAIGWLLLTGALAFTDFLDGRAARSLGHVSKFGKLVDPLMDKLTGITGIFLFCQLVRLADAPQFLRMTTNTVSWTMVLIEFSLAFVAIRAVIWLKLRALSEEDVAAGESKLGANRYGKRKFLIQSFALAVGYFLIYLAGPIRGLVAASVYTVAMSFAVGYGYLSLRRHLHDAREVQRAAAG